MLGEKGVKRTDGIRDTVFASLVILACLLVLAWQFCALCYWAPDIRKIGSVTFPTPEEIVRLDRFETAACFIPALFFLVMTILGVLESVWSVKGKRLRIGMAWIATVVIALFGIVSLKLWWDVMAP